MYCQTLTPEEAQNFRWNIFDVTKVWPHSEVPLRRIGKMTLNRNATNYFAEIEQLAFAPAHLVPGIESSADPMLQARLFSYSDSQRHRLGVNYQQIPVNRPLNVYAPWQRDGPATINGNYGHVASYPSSIEPVAYKPVAESMEHEQWVGKAVRNIWEVTDEDFVQPRMLWKVLGKQSGQQDNFVYNVSVHLSGAVAEVRRRTYGMFSNVDKELGRRIEEATEKKASESDKDQVIDGIMKVLEA
jgi:catalase